MDISATLALGLTLGSILLWVVIWTIITNVDILLSESITTRQKILLYIIVSIIIIMYIYQLLVYREIEEFTGKISYPL